MFFALKSLYVKLEAVEGQPETLSPADVVEVRNLSMEPYVGDRLTKDLDRMSFGSQEEYNVNPHRSFSFEVLLAAAGEASKAPAWGRLLRICGFKETIDATAGAEVVTYNVISGDCDSAHFEVRRPLKGDTTRHQQYRSNGVRGSWSLELSAKQWPLLKFDNLLGSHVPVAKVPNLAVDSSAWKDPVAVTNDNTPKIQMDGYDLVMQSFSVSGGLNVVRRNLPGEQRTVSSGRDITGTITVKAPDLDDRDFFADVESHQGITLLPIEIRHGTAPGGIIDISMPRVQLTNITETDIDGDLGYQMNFRALPSDAGDDEFELRLPHNP
ncbi:MAG: hypothetical protein OIF57_10490 [Marinobacterium sp.]|nr:hypothetical protein [Marinobacterium sp.]